MGHTAYSVLTLWFTVGPWTIQYWFDLWRCLRLRSAASVVRDVYMIDPQEKL